MPQPPPPGDNEEFWRQFLLHGDPRERRNRAIFRRLPSNPRCRLCAAPFGGIGAPLMRAIGKRPADGNPNLCSNCFTFVTSNHGGAEIEISLLFADIRGSTSLAETMPPGEYRALLDRFYNVAADAIFASDGFLDKFVGDEVVATFAPLLTGELHASRAVEAARALMKATGHGTADGPWVPLGAGVHTGRVWMGAVGEGAAANMTALGDAVNVAARLAALAEAGEILVTADAALAAGVDTTTLPHKSLELKGRQQLTEVVSMRIGAAGPVSA
jgi:adenylate cyclase